VSGEPYSNVIKARQFVNDAMAGCLTACIFYAEYISLGATFNQALPGSGAKALGAVMVIGAVIACCVAAMLLPNPIIAGPRAASLAVLIVGMSFAAEQTAQAEGKTSAALAALLVIVSVAACVQLIGLRKSVQNFFKTSSLPLRKGFMYATATAIVVGLSERQLEGCLRSNPAATLLIFLISIAFALVWSVWCQAAEKKNPTAWLAKLSSLSLLVGVAVATAGYYAFLAATVSNGQCATIGNAGFKWAYFSQLVITPTSLHQTWLTVPMWVWPVLVLLGFVAGAAMLLESFTTLTEMNVPSEGNGWSRCIKCSALVNLVCAPLGLSCSSFSASRTTALRDARGVSAAAVVWHAVALLLILFGLSEWISKMPVIAVAVALTLVAVQMIDKTMYVTVWGAGLDADAKASNVKDTWQFLSVLVLSLVVGCWLRYFGQTFSGGAVVALIVCAAVYYSWPKIDGAKRVM
jgi:hypothetical protein